MTRNPEVRMARAKVIACIAMAASASSCADGMALSDWRAATSTAISAGQGGYDPAAAVVAVTSNAPTLTPPPTRAVAPDPGGAIDVTWEDLNELDLTTGEPPADLAQLNGQRVRIPGFMVPLEDSAESVTEFLLVPFVGACIHVPPPPANQMVHILMDEGESAQMYWWDPIWIYGTLHIENTEHFYGKASYRLDGERAELYTPGG